MKVLRFYLTGDVVKDYDFVDDGDPALAEALVARDEGRAHPNLKSQGRGYE